MITPNRSISPNTFRQEIAKRDSALNYHATRSRQRIESMLQVLIDQNPKAKAAFQKLIDENPELVD